MQRFLDDSEMFRLATVCTFPCGDGRFERRSVVTGMRYSRCLGFIALLQDLALLCQRRQTWPLLCLCRCLGNQDSELVTPWQIYLCRQLQSSPTFPATSTTE